MTTSKERAIIWSARLGLPQLFKPKQPQNYLTTILFHHFRFGDESWATAKDRLRFQLDVLAREFQPLTLAKALSHQQGLSPAGPRPLLVTIDDAKREILDVIDLFDDFGIPVTQFVCAGWSARASTDLDDAGRTIRVVARLHFYNGPLDTVRLSGQDYQMNHAGNAALIDAVITATGGDDLATIAALDEKLHDPTADDPVCNWNELRDLQSAGMAMGCHSVSHPRIGQQSPTRKTFEIVESWRYLNQKLGDLDAFAYPYGTPDSHDQDTLALLKSLDVQAGFTTSAAFTGAQDDMLALPRIALPDDVMSVAAFRARVLGGGIPLQRMKALIS